MTLSVVSVVTSSSRAKTCFGKSCRDGQPHIPDIPVWKSRIWSLPDNQTMQKRPKAFALAFAPAARRHQPWWMLPRKPCAVGVGDPQADGLMMSSARVPHSSFTDTKPTHTPPHEPWICWHAKYLREAHSASREPLGPCKWKEGGFFSLSCRFNRQRVNAAGNVLF